MCVRIENSQISSNKIQKTMTPVLKEFIKIEFVQ